MSTLPTSYDAELQRHNDVLRRVAGVQAHDDVLDVGCGTGQTTRQVASVARFGRAMGVDVSATAIARARESARAEECRNVVFQHADAQTHPFPQAHFDLAISRFGTMFFDDAVAAFANIARALRPGGRLVMMVWQAAALNEWDVVIRRCLDVGGSVAGVPEGPDPFSLAEPPVVREILQNAGFYDVAFTEVREPVYYGRDVDTALEWVRGFTSTTAALRRLGAADAALAVERLRKALAEHLDDSGVWFDSRAWIVAAHRR